MRKYLLTVGLALGLAQFATAQAPFVYKPIDTGKMVQAGDAVSGATAGASRGIFGTMTRTLAGAIDGNGFVKTINNLLGRRAQPTPMQSGLSPLPLPSSYQSTLYPNSFSPVMPVNGGFGQSPASVLPK